MKTTLIFTIILTFLSQLTVLAQSEKQNPEFKIYYNINQLNFQETFNISGNEYLWISPEITEHSSGNISLALILKPKSSIYHEFELMPFVLNKSKYIKSGITGDNSEILSGKGKTLWNSHFRYQIGYSLISKEKFRTYLGFSSMLNYFNYKSDSYTSIDFPEKYAKVGLIFGLTPGMEIKLTDNVNLSLDVPVGIYGLNMNYIEYNSPSIPSSEMKQNKFKSEFWNQGLQVRLGLGIKL